MDFNLEHAIQILSRTPETLNSLLRNLPEPWLMQNEGPDTWSPYDIVGHLIHGEETDWIRRAKIILEHGEARPFDPFDREAMFEKSKGKTIADLLDTFARLRSQNLRELQMLNLTPESLEKRGTHPELGTVTLKQLLATWVVHDLGHIRQVARVMARQYKNEVGPWTAYLPVLTRD
ncbi:MAG TPA: DinB family protein [Pyrinomonadaceae bacterium]